MKKKLIQVLSLGMAVSIFFASCGANDDDVNDTSTESNIVPQKFKVDIPDAISHNNSSSQKIAEGEVINGAVIYENIAYFIRIGEISAELIEAIIGVIYYYNLTDPMEFTYVSDDDGRTKTVIIAEDVTRGDENWEYEMIINDQDGSQALQVVWNNSPVDGIAILSIYDLNRTENANLAETRYRVDYSEAGENGYDAEMTVYLSGIPANADDNGSIDRLKMFAGKSGDEIDVFGNSNHPDLVWEDYETKIGRSYGFRARGNEVLDLGVAEAGIPYTDQTVADSIFDYDLYKVAYDLVRANPEYASADDSTIAYHVDQYVTNDEVPAFFYNDQYHSSGIDNMPSDLGFTSEFSDLSDLTPYVPADVATMEVDFLQ